MSLPINAGCEYEIEIHKKYFPTIRRPCGEINATLYEISRAPDLSKPVGTITGKQKLCFKHKQALEARGFILCQVSQTTKT